VEVLRHPCVDQLLSLTSTTIVFGDYSIVIDISWSNVTLPTSHISDEDTYGSNGPYLLVNSPTRSTIIIVFPLHTLFNQLTTDTCHLRDALAALMACHIIHDIIVLTTLLDKSQGRSTTYIPLAQWQFDSSPCVVNAFVVVYLLSRHTTLSIFKIR
jgi:hypothetical protein